MQRVYGTTHSFKSGHRSNKKPPLGKKKCCCCQSGYSFLCTDTASISLINPCRGDGELTGSLLSVSSENRSREASHWLCDTAE